MEFIAARQLTKMADDKKWYEIRLMLTLFSLEQRRVIVSKKMKKKKSLFVMAVESGHSYLVKYFIDDCDANVMEMGPCLCIAAEKGFLHIVKILVENGSDVNELDPKGFSPLYFACIAGDVEMVVHLIINGANVNLVANVERMTPLMASLRYPEICKYLLIKGADPQFMNSYGRTALIMAIEMEVFYHIEERLLGSRAGINAMNIYENDFAFILLQSVVELLKSYSTDVTESLSRCYQFHTCNAALSRDYYDVQIYWSMYTQIQGSSFNGPPFEIEHPNSRRSCFEPILNIFDQYNRNVFFYLENYFDLCSPYTLQALATSMSLVDNVINGFKLFSFILETLASCNNDLFFNTLPNVVNVYVRLNMMTSYDFYGRLENGSLEILQTYSNHVEQIAARVQRMDNIERDLISVKIDSVFSIVASLIWTLLMENEGDMSLLKGCIEKIVQFDLRGSDNNTLLHFCTKAKYPVEIYKVLLLCKAEINSRNQRGFTPVHFVLDNEDHEQTAIIEYFLSHGFLFDTSNDQEFCLSCSLKERNILPQPVKHTTLQCLAANVASKNVFSYYEVPRYLENLILLHS